MCPVTAGHQSGLTGSAVIAKRAHTPGACPAYPSRYLLARSRSGDIGSDCRGCCNSKGKERCCCRKEWAGKAGGWRGDGTGSHRQPALAVLRRAERLRIHLALEEQGPLAQVWVYTGGNLGSPPSCLQVLGQSLSFLGRRLCWKLWVWTGMSLPGSTQICLTASAPGTCGPCQWILHLLFVKGPMW
jgi:hypothetical protein